MLDQERLKRDVSDEELELIFRIARIALEMDNGSGHYERVLEKSSMEIDSIFTLIDEVIHDR